MIINYSSNDPHKFWGQVNLKLEENTVWNFKLLNFVGKFHSKIKSSGVYEISTNMIERDEANARGVVGYVILDENLKFLNFQPTHLPTYKMRFSELCSTVFDLRSVRTGENLKFEELAFTLEISNSHEWV